MFETVATVTDGPEVAMIQALMRAIRRLLAFTENKMVSVTVTSNNMTREATTLPPTTAPIFTVGRRRDTEQNCYAHSYTCENHAISITILKFEI